MSPPAMRLSGHLLRHRFNLPADSRGNRFSDSPASDTAGIMTIYGSRKHMFDLFYRKGFLTFNWLDSSVKMHACHQFIYIDNWLINFIIVESNFFFLRDLMQWKS